MVCILCTDICIKNPVFTDYFTLQISIRLFMHSFIFGWYIRLISTFHLKAEVFVNFKCAVVIEAICFCNLLA